MYSFMVRLQPHVTQGHGFKSFRSHTMLYHDRNRSGDRGRTSRGDKPYCIRYGGMGVGITNGRGIYSMSWARLMIPQPCKSFGIYGAHFRNEIDGSVSCWCTETNQSRRRLIHKAEASTWCEERSISRNFTRYYW